MHLHLGSIVTIELVWSLAFPLCQAQSDFRIRSDHRRTGLERRTPINFNEGLPDWSSNKDKPKVKQYLEGEEAAQKCFEDELRNWLDYPLRVGRQQRSSSECIQPHDRS